VVPKAHPSITKGGGVGLGLDIGMYMYMWGLDRENLVPIDSQHDII